MLNKYKKIIFDVILNICATALPLVALQLLILPFLARYIGDEPYGKMLTMISALTVVSGSLGNALNNIRLIKSSAYEKKEAQGDFNLLIVIEMAVSAIGVCLIAYQYSVEIADLVLFAFLALLWVYREYAIVFFRLNLNFMGIVLNNVIMVIGYLVGTVLFMLTSQWQWIYICGITCSILYVLKKSDLSYNKWKRTELFAGTAKDLIILVAASLLLNLLNYADRMLIYPMLGGAAVSIYYASTLFGKVISSAISPINAVVLSYIAKKESMHKQNMIKIIGAMFLIACVGYAVCNLVAKPALLLMYPEWALESMKYVPIMTVVAMITMISSVLTPFVMKFCEMKWQLIINLSVLCIYLLASILLYKSYGLMGFCFGVLISNAVKLFIMIYLGIKLTGKKLEV